MSALSQYVSTIATTCRDFRRAKPACGRPVAHEEARVDRHARRSIGITANVKIASPIAWGMVPRDGKGEMYVLDQGRNQAFTLTPATRR